MPAITSKLVLSSAAQSANTVLADIDLIKGALYGVSTFSDLGNIHSNYVEDGQLMFVQDVSKFYSLTITAANPPVTFTDTFTWNEVTLGASGALTADDTGSFILASQTSSMSVATASFISDSFISASAARSGFGSGGSGGSGIFTQVGSDYTTTNNLQITGSVTVNNGLFKLTEFTTLPNVEEGAMAYSASNFYFGIGDV
jgi:hypothetical protein